MVIKMENLLNETVGLLVKYNKTRQDIDYVMAGDEWCTWEDFESRAKGINYDSGYGLAEINSDLCVVGKDWWLRRREYDGAEWWEFNTMPTKPKTQTRRILITTMEKDNYKAWRRVAKLVEADTGTMVDWHEKFFVCPECGEPLYEMDWDWYNLEDELKCPICDGDLQ